ncbi:MAG TPA: hypothetical protein VNJ51_08115 [Candidatus Dormibacteraeota bacterium]|nr:hypothetical protein [Candidatus Dormibacteraeota bacterium]
MSKATRAGWFALTLALALGGAGCARRGGMVAYVDTQRISANWPKFINYQNQLYSDLQAIEDGKGSDAQKAAEVARVQRLYRRYEADLTTQVRAAAAQVAQRDGYRLIVTREGRAYGGVDVTKQVEKILNVTERVTRQP